MTVILCPRLFTGLRVTSYRVSNLGQVGSGHGSVCQTSSLTQFSSEFHCAHFSQYCFLLAPKTPLAVAAACTASKLIGYAESGKEVFDI